MNCKTNKLVHDYPAMIIHPPLVEEISGKSVAAGAIADEEGAESADEEDDPFAHVMLGLGDDSQDETSSKGDSDHGSDSAKASSSHSVVAAVPKEPTAQEIGVLTDKKHKIISSQPDTSKDLKAALELNESLNPDTSKDVDAARKLDLELNGSQAAIAEKSGKALGKPIETDLDLHRAELKAKPVMGEGKREQLQRVLDRLKAKLAGKYRPLLVNTYRLKT